jgi:hypothetical protein
MTASKTPVDRGPDGRLLPGRAKTGGRRPGGRNKVTEDFRATVQRLLDDNRDNFAVWLTAVAEGTPDVVDEAGKIIKHGRPPNPEAAIRCAASLAEYAAPKLSRSEVTGEGGGALTIVVNKLA